MKVKKAAFLKRMYFFLFYNLY